MVFQDARAVKTKQRKTFEPWFFPVGDDIEQIVVDWARFLIDVKLWGLDDPLFPATKVAVVGSGQFQPVGFDPQGWSSTGPIRTIFREAFERAGLRYSNPHSFRNTLAALGREKCKTFGRNAGVGAELRPRKPHDYIRQLWQGRAASAAGACAECR